MSNEYPTNYEVEQVINYVKSVNWNKRLDKEIPFLTRLFEKEQYHEICDLGCGPGIHAVRLANNPNFNVTGLDIDQNMISYSDQMSKQQNLKNINFKQGNFLHQEELVEFKEKFDVIYTLGNALMIIWTTNDNFSITEIFQKLSFFIKPGGSLFFQILNSDAPRNGHVVSKISSTEDGDNQILVKHFMAVDGKLYTTFSNLRWKVDSKDISVTDTRKGFLKIVPLESLQLSMEEAGFSDFQFFENYEGKPFQKESSDSLMCYARKKNLLHRE